MTTETTTRRPAAQIKIGDRAGRTKTTMKVVTGIEEHPKMVRLTFVDDTTAQPAKTTPWWVEPNVVNVLEGDPVIDAVDDAAAAEKAEAEEGADYDAAGRPDARDEITAKDFRVFDPDVANANRERLANLKGPGADRVTFKDAAEIVLRKADGPMKVAAIADAAIPLVRPAPAGKTPKATLGAHLITDANKGGRFVKTAPGTFDVRELNPRGAQKRPAKRNAKKGGKS